MGLFPKPGVVESLSPENIAQTEPYATNYEYNEELLKELGSDLITHATKQPTTPLGCYIVGNETKLSNLGRAVEGRVFGETFSNSTEVMHKEYGAYEDASTFYVVMDHQSQLPVGVMRIIKNSPAGLKSLNDLETESTLALRQDDILDAYSINLDRCIDIATLAVLEDYRGSRQNYIPSMLTYRTLFLDVLNNDDYDHVVAIIDEKAERNLTYLKFPFYRIFNSEGFNYLDSSTSYALYAQTKAFYPQVSYWVQRYAHEGKVGDDSKKLWKASAMDALINPGPYDEMMGYARPLTPLSTR